VLPDGLSVALRVFGHTKPGSCDTELLIPLGPLDRTAFARAVERIRSVNRSKTAIAAALRKAGEDLQGVAGTRLLVLVTDGEETCGGDPAAEIERLKQQGVSVQLNIVGFAVDDAATRELFKRWSSAGGGHYFDASDLKGLQSAIRQAAALGFSVLDASGAEVAQGTTGGAPIELPPGRYRVIVPALGLDAPTIVKSGNTTTLDAGAEAR